MKQQSQAALKRKEDCLTQAIVVKDPVLASGDGSVSRVLKKHEGPWMKKRQHTFAYCLVSLPLFFNVSLYVHTLMCMAVLLCRYAVCMCAYGV